MKQQQTIANRIAKNVQKALKAIPRVLNDEKEMFLSMTKNRARRVARRQTRRAGRKTARGVRRAARAVGRARTKLSIAGARAKKRAAKPRAKKRVARSKVKKLRRAYTAPMMQAA